MAPFIESPGQGADRRRARARSAPGSTRRSSRCGPTGTPTPSTRARSRSSTPATPSDTAPIAQARPPRRRRTRSIKERLKDADDELRDRHRQGHDAHRLRRAAAAHPLPGPAAQGRAADADPRPGQPHVPRQAGRPARRVRAAGREPAARRSPSTPRPTRRTKPVGRDIDEAAALRTRAGRAARRGCCAGYDWRGKLAAATPGAGSRPRSALDQLPALPATPGQPAGRGRGRRSSTGSARSPSQLARAWALAAGVADARRPARRGAVLRRGPGLDGKFDAAGAAGARRAGPRGDPAAARRASSPTSTETGEVVDIYEAAGHAQAVAVATSAPSSSPRRSRPSNPHLAIEALRDLAHRGVRQGDAQQPRAAARVLRAHRRADEQVHQPAAHLRRGHRRADRAGQGGRGRRQPRRALHAAARLSDELAFYDAVATNESAVERPGRGRARRRSPASSSRSCGATSRTDWTVRDDVRAKLRSSIKRLLVKYKYPPDKQPEAIKLVMEQMEAMAPRYAAWNRAWTRVEGLPTPLRPPRGPRLESRRRRCRRAGSSRRAGCPDARLVRYDRLHRILPVTPQELLTTYLKAQLLLSKLREAAP